MIIFPAVISLPSPAPRSSARHRDALVRGPRPDPAGRPFLFFNPFSIATSGNSERPRQVRQIVEADGLLTALDLANELVRELFTS